MDTLWLRRTGADGGTEYVCFRDDQGAVEMIEAYHLPPQMPLVKRRWRLDPSDALHRRRCLEGKEGFRHGSPLF